MNHEFSTTFEFHPKQMYYKMVYYRPNAMIGFLWEAIAEEALYPFLRDTAQWRSQKTYAQVK